MEIHHSSTAKRQPGHRWLAGALGILVGACVVLAGQPRVQARETNAGVAKLRELSQAFTDVAKRAIPAVVYVKVERTVEARGFNNPFDLFSDEFFKRFFGRRLPEGQQPREFRQQGQGSGFIVSKDGYILTNNHVVGEADRVTVVLNDGREFKAKLVGTDPRSDVAVIKIDSAGDLPVLPLGDSDALEVGEWVMAIGSPFGLTHTITVGVVSAKGRSRLGIADYEDFIQTDAAINPGNSGGPLINLNGEAIGIDTAIFSRSGGYMGIGFAIPINMARDIQRQLISTGKVVRGYLGVRIQDVTEALAKSFDLEKAEGVLVAEVSKGTPADKAGFKRGDVIVKFNHEPTTDTGQLRNLVAMTPPGTQVPVEVIRDGKQHTLSVEVGTLPEKLAAATSEPALQKELGMSVQNLTDELAEQLGYKGQQGVVISEVEPGSPAALAGLRSGMLITQVNRRSVNNTDEFQEALAASSHTKRVLLLVHDRQGSHFVALRLD
jgi:serine protease Do